MPMRRAIGISLACFVTSACATGETLEESKSDDPVEAPGIAEQIAETPADNSRNLPCAATQERQSADRRGGHVFNGLFADGDSRALAHAVPFGLEVWSVPFPDRTNNVT